MKFGSKNAIVGVIWGFDLVWESATPPTHIWEKSPNKKLGFITPSLIADFHCMIVICSLVVDVPAEVFDQSLPLLVMVFNKSD